MHSKETADKAVILIGFARLNVPAFTVAVGVISGLLLFTLTAVLLLNAAPGDPYVGANLKGLGKYLPGYTVSWLGSTIGLVYGFVFGAIGGFLTAVLWNLTHYIYISLVLIRALWWRMLAD